MSFKLLLLPRPPWDPPPEPFFDDDWPEKIERAVPGAVVKAFKDPRDAADDIVDADAAYGTLLPELFVRAKRLRWAAAPGAGVGPGWFFDELVKSDVVVTNTRGIYNDHLSAHVLAFILTFARRLDHYLARQPQKSWVQDQRMIGLAGKTVVLVGVGGAGAETGRLCAALGMRVIGVDPRVTEWPAELAALVRPDRLDECLKEADFVVVTVPETPDTLGMFNARRFSCFKRGAYFINVGRGRCVVTDDLVQALRTGQLAGAGLDVMSPEPLPPEHPLWTMPGVLITPHIAILGAPNQKRREALLIENCRRFAKGEPLLNIVDKSKWF